MSTTVGVGRLARAVHLDCERIGNGAWQVTGGVTAHVVDEHGAECDCFDYARRGEACKHILAVRLRLGDRETLEGLRLLVVLPTRNLARR